MINNLALWCIVPAAGIGLRFGSYLPKQYLSLGKKTVIESAIEPILGLPCRQIIVAIAENDEYWPTLTIASHPLVKAITGGHERYQSVLNGLNAIEEQASDDDWVLVHDAARPCLTTELVQSLFRQLEKHPVGGLLAVPIQDTIKKANAQKIIDKTINRQNLWLAQTPQLFRYGVLKKALKTAIDNNIMITDESSAVEYLGLKPQLVKGSIRNIKITHPDDVYLVHYYLANLDKKGE